MDRYTIGIDFGSNNGRIVLIEIERGYEVYSTEMPYRHGNIAERFHIESEYVLHHPIDYLTIILKGIPKILKQTGIKPNHIVAIGIDATTSSVLPTNNEGVPLCFDDEYCKSPHAYIKLWKDHSAQKEAIYLNGILGGERKLSAEWLIPKIAHIYVQDRMIYDAASRFMEVGDWIVWYMTGNERRGRLQAEFTSTWNFDKGFIDNAVLEKFSDDFKDVYSKLADKYYYPYEVAGEIRPDITDVIGLPSNVLVCVSNIDAIAAMAATGVTEANALVSVIGTSSCHLIHSEDNKDIPLSEKVKDAVIPGLYTYISSQVAVGDCFRWCFENIIPYKYHKEARKRGLTVLDYIETKINERIPMQSGCVALACLNGFRVGSGGRGFIGGINLNTDFIDIYQSFIEATAFDLKEIVDSYESNDIAVKKIIATGGIAYKSPAIM